MSAAAGNGGRRTPHQPLTDAPGAVREIVSRLLERVEQRGCTAQSREQVGILDARSLRAPCRRRLGRDRPACRGRSVTGQSFGPSRRSTVSMSRSRT